MPSSKGEYYPRNGEQYLMKYYHQEMDLNNIYALSGSFRDYKRSIATEDDVNGLLWLTSIKIEQ